MIINNGPFPFNCNCAVLVENCVYILWSMGGSAVTAAAIAKSIQRDKMGEQVHREPQWGLGKHYRGPYHPHPYSVCLEIEMLKASRGRKRGERCPVTIRLGFRGNIVSSPSRVQGGAPADNGFCAYFRLERSHLEHHFQYS